VIAKDRKQAPKIQTFTLLEGLSCPVPPPGHCICPTCLEPMPVWYGWKSSESVVHIMLRCDCGSRSKGKLIHYRIDKKGRLTW